MSVVLDTNVVLAGLRSSKGASFQLLRLIEVDRIDFLLSVPLVLEYEAVLKRPENLAATRLTLEEVEQVLNALCLVGIENKIHYLWRPRLSDPKDDMVLELAVNGQAEAVNGQAEAIVTFNTADFKQAVDQFDIKLLKPGEYLYQLRRK